MDFSNPIERGISSYFNKWIENSSTIGWIITNPVLSFAILLLAIFLLGGLFKALGRGSEWMWLFLLALPWKLIQPTLKFGWKTIDRLLNRDRSNPSISKKAIAPAKVPPQVRMKAIVTRLAEIDREQSLLLAELSSLIDRQK
jgi:hypothetical protein